MIKAVKTYRLFIGQSVLKESRGYRSRSVDINTPKDSFDYPDETCCWLRLGEAVFDVKKELQKQTDSGTLSPFIRSMVDEWSAGKGIPSADRKRQ